MSPCRFSWLNLLILFVHILTVKSKLTLTRFNITLKTPGKDEPATEYAHKSVHVKYNLPDQVDQWNIVGFEPQIQLHQKAIEQLTVHICNLRLFQSIWYDEEVVCHNGQSMLIYQWTSSTSLSPFSLCGGKIFSSQKKDRILFCVLLTTGSLNPIHHSHVKNLRLARAFIEKHDNHPMNVLAAYISPTHDEYVRGKIGESNWIPGEQRAELCQKAIEEEELTEFIAVSRGELQFNGFMDFDSISLTLAKYLNQTLQELKPITVVYVCGLDHFNKCPYVQSLAQEDHMACAVIYRLGANDQRIKAASEQFPNRLYYVTLEDEIEAGSLVDKSSTEIREKYRNAIEQESDDSIYKCVFEYYKNKHIK